MHVLLLIIYLDILESSFFLIKIRYIMPLPNYVRKFKIKMIILYQAFKVIERNSLLIKILKTLIMKMILCIIFQLFKLLNKIK